MSLSAPAVATRARRGRPRVVTPSESAGLYPSERQRRVPVVTSVRPCESVSVPVLIVRDRVCEPCVKNRITDQHAAHRVRGIAATGPSVTKCEVNVQRGPGDLGADGHVNRHTYLLRSYIAHTDGSPRPATSKNHGPRNKTRRPLCFPTSRVGRTHRSPMMTGNCSLCMMMLNGCFVRSGS